MEETTCRPKLGEEDDIKIGLKLIGRDCVYWIWLPPDTVQ